MNRTSVLIVAAGRGLRAGGTQPKQYAYLAGKMVLTHTMQAFDMHPAISSVFTVIHPDDEALYQQAAHSASSKLQPAVLGGTSRQQSVLNGLMAAQEAQVDNILIHDAARPFVDEALISRVIDGLREHEAVLPVMPITDTVKQVSNGVVDKTLDRNCLYGAQTPQGFHFGRILQLHQQAAETHDAGFTDDASIAEHFGVEVQTVNGSMANGKLTTPMDMKMGELLLQQSRENNKVETRTGMGFDVHSFEPGDSVTLCGVDIPHSHKLKGHSDADVAMHALTDAILGTIGEGDIGAHFPPTEARWRGAASSVFLEHAMQLVQKAGGRLINADVTIICERPKIGQHRDSMRQALADIMQVPLSRVSVKATTTEKLGFTGRSEGIAANAVAAIELTVADDPSEADGEG